MNIDQLGTNISFLPKKYQLFGGTKQLYNSLNDKLFGDPKQYNSYHGISFFVPLYTHPYLYEQSFYSNLLHFLFQDEPIIVQKEP